MKWNFKNFLVSILDASTFAVLFRQGYEGTSYGGQAILDARQQTIPKAFPGYGLAFAETSGFEAATRRGFFEEFFPAI